MLSQRALDRIGKHFFYEKRLIDNRNIIDELKDRLNQLTQRSGTEDTDLSSLASKLSIEELNTIDKKGR